VIASERAGFTWLVGVWKFVAPLVGIAAPGGVGAWLAGGVSLWLVVGGAVVLLVALFVEGAFRLWRDAAAKAFPHFPRRRLDLGNPMYFSGEGRLDDAILFHLTYTNRSETAVALTIVLFWEWERTEGEMFGPHSLSPVTRGLGDLKVLQQPIAVEPHRPISGHVAFSVATAFGVTKGNYADGVLRPGMRLFLRVTDFVSDAEIDKPLPVRALMTPRDESA
jgi:hypothetical protein